MEKKSLRELRAKFNETQTETAQALDVSPQTYNAWEQNPGIIKLSNLKKIQEHFKISLDEIRL